MCFDPFLCLCSDITVPLPSIAGRPPVILINICIGEGFALLSWVTALWIEQRPTVLGSPTHLITWMNSERASFRIFGEETMSGFLPFSASLTNNKRKIVKMPAHNVGEEKKKLSLFIFRNANSAKLWDFDIMRVHRWKKEKNSSKVRKKSKTDIFSTSRATRRGWKSFRDGSAHLVWRQVWGHLHGTLRMSHHKPISVNDCVLPGKRGQGPVP